MRAVGPSTSSKWAFCAGSDTSVVADVKSSARTEVGIFTDENVARKKIAARPFYSQDYRRKGA